MFLLSIIYPSILKLQIAYQTSIKYQSQDILVNMYQSLERYIPLFETYLKEKNPKGFVQKLHDPTEKTIIQLLTEDVSDLKQFREKMAKLNLSRSLQEALVQYKLVNHVKNTEKIGDNQIGKEIKLRFSTNNFDFPRPATISADGPSEQEDKTPTSLNIEHNYEKYLTNKLHSNPSFIKNINDHAISKLPEKDLLNLPTNQKEYLIQKCGIIYHFKPQFLSKFILAFQNQKLKTNKNFLISKKQLAEFTREQIDCLGKMKPDLFNNEDYVELWFNLHYSERINKYVEGCAYFTKQEQEVKRRAYMQMASELDKHKHLIIKSYVRKLREEILLLDLIVNDPCLDRLVKYLKTQCSNTNLKGIQKQFVKEIQNRSHRDSQHHSKYMPRMRYVLEIEEYGFDNAVEEYISKLFKLDKKNNDSIKRLSEFFRQDYLRRINVKAMLQRGQIPDNLNEYFDRKQLDEMKNKKEIKLHSSNKKLYKVQDDIVINAMIKNVNNIHVKVYELSVQKTYLLSQHGPLSDEANLSFLKPTFEEIYEHKLINPYAVEEVNILVNIEKKMGIFIIDLQGDTVTSRAVIRKGNIICLESFNEAGQRFSFHDEDGKALTEAQSLKVWVNNRDIDLKGKNHFQIDYPEEEQYATIVASIGNYSEKYEKKIIKEQYVIDIDYLFNSEGFIVGKKAKIILHGRLKMNNNPMSLELLKDIKITANVINNQGIATFYEFQVKKWSDRDDQTIEFPIQSYVKNIEVNFSAKIMCQTKKEISLSNSKVINIELGEGSQNFLDFYMEKDKNEHYVLNLFGMNGEPIANTQVVLTYVVRGVEEDERSTVKTDKVGKIKLGSLSLVRQISAQTSTESGQISRVWQLNKEEQAFSHPSQLYIKVGQTITLPVDASWTKNDITLLRTFDKYHAQDYSNKITVKDGLLTLPTFTQEGFYIMKFLPTNKYIDVHSLKNIKWEGDNDQNQTVFDGSTGRVYEIKNNLNRNISIGNIDIKRNGPHHKVKVQLNTQGLNEQQFKNIRVHAFATNYISAEFKDVFNAKYMNQETKCKKYYNCPKQSKYYSNKNLSDQGAYVWNRQQQSDTHIGNNLEKPGIFLKRTLVRQTNQEDEDLFDGDVYQDEACMMMVNPNIRAQLKKKKLGTSAKVSLTGRYMTSMNSHNNFLLLSGHIDSNIKGSVFQVDVPSNYNQLELVILTPSSAIKKTFSLRESEDKKFKDLRHAGIAQTQNNKGWTMSREVYTLKAGEQKMVSRNSQWRTVGMKDIFQFANAKRHTLFDWHKHLLSWHSYTQDKKRTIYDKQCCHELNTFIRFKDPDFFRKVVSEYIRNKVVKTFVDFCLLEDINEVKQFVPLDKFNLLNSFEKALLVHVLVEKKQMFGEAKRIVQMMQMEESSVKRDYQEFKHSFDTIINAKASEQEPARRGGARTKQTARKSGPGASQTNSITHCMQMEVQQCEQQFGGGGGMQSCDFMASSIGLRKQKMEIKKPFVAVQSTKEYTERTYYTVKRYREEAPMLILRSAFWPALARHFLEGSSVNILLKQFMTLNRPIDFILASCFLSSQSSANFELEDAEENYKIKANSPMLLYVKEVKELDFLNKFGIQMNQRFVDPQNRYIFEDGIQTEREVQQFVINRPYICQTVVTNTSGTSLELQILLDIPKGTIPLCSHEYTQIVNITLNAFTSKDFTRYFYAPSEGQYPIYPSNACRGPIIIAKCASRANIQVKRYHTINKLQSFSDILRSGDRQEIIKFIQHKNIFDRNVFSPELILWMLKEKEFYFQVIGCLRERKFYNRNIWGFAFLHNDISTIREILNMDNNIDCLSPEIFEYFPYYSTRTHQFANQTKSTIRNVQFKETYLKFLVSSVINISQPSSFAVSFAYFLILQDRLRQAEQIIKILTDKYPKQHQIQVDYMRCFLDMSLNTHNFSVARQIITKYKGYPIESWTKLFNQVRNTLDAEDQEFIDNEQFKKTEEFQTQVIQEADNFKIIQPADTTIRVEFFQINLQLMFSEFPFSDNQGWFAFVQPSVVKVLEGQKETKQIAIRRSDYPNIKDATIQITEARKGSAPKKVILFQWANPEVKVKTNQKAGTLQVFVSKKKRAGAYVKVFSKKEFQGKFYRDGYTDMTGTFRYAMSDLDGITEFAILVQTDKGGCMLKVKPPSKLASY